MVRESCVHVHTQYLLLHNSLTQESKARLANLRRKGSNQAGLEIPEKPAIPGPLPARVSPV